MMRGILIIIYLTAHARVYCLSSQIYYSDAGATEADVLIAG